MKIKKANFNISEILHTNILFLFRSCVKILSFPSIKISRNMRSFLQQIFYPREKYNREINNIEWGKKKIWTNNQRLINKKEALIRAYRKLSPRHELISFV